MHYTAGATDLCLHLWRISLPDRCRHSQPWVVCFTWLGFWYFEASLLVVQAGLELNMWPSSARTIGIYYHAQNWESNRGFRAYQANTWTSELCPSPLKKWSTDLKSSCTDSQLCLIDPDFAASEIKSTASVLVGLISFGHFFCDLQQNFLFLRLT